MASFIVPKVHLQSSNIVELDFFVFVAKQCSFSRCVARFICQWAWGLFPLIGCCEMDAFILFLTSFVQTFSIIYTECTPTR